MRSQIMLVSIPDILLAKTLSMSCSCARIRSMASATLRGEALALLLGSSAIRIGPLLRQARHEVHRYRRQIAVRCGSACRTSSTNHSAVCTASTVTSSLMLFQQLSRPRTGPSRFSDAKVDMYRPPQRKDSAHLIRRISYTCIATLGEWPPPWWYITLTGVCWYRQGCGYTSSVTPMGWRKMLRRFETETP